jgi:drug/metabolite transporter (DMT)-like permease
LRAESASNGPAAAPASARTGLALAVGIVAVSSAAVLISLARAQGAPAILVAALRMTAAALVLGPVALVRCRGELRRLRGRDLLLAIASGICLALHFGFWISSLDYTSVMSSVVFVSTNPIFVGALSLLVLKEKPGLGLLVGAIVAVAGGAVVGIADIGAGGGESLKGDILALLGAVAASGYLLLGRTLRKTMSLPLYAGIAYSTAAVALMAVVGITATPVIGFPPMAYLWIGLLALGPQIIGHTAYNWALKYVSATLVTVTLLAEPVGATLLAIPVLSQVPSPLRLGGGVLILAGIAVAARAEARSRNRTIPGKSHPPL